VTVTPRLLREGVIGGLIGATMVAVWFLIYDAARGAPFRTPTLLGSAALQGVQNPQAVPVSTGLVVQYTVLHGVVFALVGILIAFLIVSAQRQPARLLMLVIALLCFEVFFLAGVVWLQDLVDRGQFVVVFAGWLAAGHDGVMSVEPAFAGHDRNLAEVAWRAPDELLAGDFRPAALLKLLDLGNLPELSRPEA